MTNLTLCRTKAGHGFKVVIDGTWYYTSIGELVRLLKGQASGCTFRQIDDIKDGSP